MGWVQNCNLYIRTSSHEMLFLILCMGSTDLVKVAIALNFNSCFWAHLCKLHKHHFTSVCGRNSYWLNISSVHLFVYALYVEIWEWDLCQYEDAHLQFYRICFYSVLKAPEKIWFSTFKNSSNMITKDVSMLRHLLSSLPLNIKCYKRILIHNCQLSTSKSSHTIYHNSIHHTKYFSTHRGHSHN